MGVTQEATEFDLIRRVQAGDHAAFQNLVEHYQAKVYSVIHGILRQHEDTEDVAQQVFAKVFFSIQSFDCRCQPLTWIYRIAVNECYSLLRRKRVRGCIEGEPVEVETYGDTRRLPTDARIAQRDLLNKLLSRVSEEDRLLLILKEVEGHSTNELATMTGRSVAAIKTQLFRIRHKLVVAAGQLSGSAGSQLQECAAAAGR